MCTSPIHLIKDGVPSSFPCGKCAECTHARQNEYMVKLWLASRVLQPLYFQTLTYSPKYDDHYMQRVNFGVRYRIQEGSRPPMFTHDSLLFNSYPEFKDFPLDDFHELYEMARINKKDAAVSCNVSDDGYLPRKINILGKIYKICPSLCRDDVKKALKKFRTDWQREFPDKPLYFKYCVVGEHGTRRYRPHYHALFLGLSQEQLNYFLNIWSNDYGNVDELHKSPINFLGDDSKKVAMYVSKYMNKGCFELPWISNLNLVEKPHVQISQYIVDVNKVEGLVNHLTLGLDTNCDTDDLDLLSRLDVAQKILIGNFKYNVSKYVRKQIFYDKIKQEVLIRNPEDSIFRKCDEINARREQYNRDHPDRKQKPFYPYPDTKIVYRYISHPLQNSLVSYKSYMHNVNSDNELAELQRIYPDKEIHEIYELLEISQKDSFKTREQNSKKDLQNTYKRRNSDF